MFWPPPFSPLPLTAAAFEACVCVSDESDITTRWMTSHRCLHRRPKIISLFHQVNSDRSSLFIHPWNTQHWRRKSRCCHYKFKFNCTDKSFRHVAYTGLGRKIESTTKLRKRVRWNYSSNSSVRLEGKTVIEVVSIKLIKSRSWITWEAYCFEPHADNMSVNIGNVQDLLCFE